MPNLFGLKIKNDLHLVSSQEIEKSVIKNASLSWSFIILLIASSTVATLGLLLGNSPIVIGGMILSPLMLPLTKISFAISEGRVLLIKSSLILLLISVIISLISAVLLTLISPIKVLNEEILARTNPTLIDIIVAITAGVVAILGVFQPKISQSLAGVAIAVSLMPPLAVSGIGLALLNFDVAIGGFVLFLANIIAIIFAGLVILAKLIPAPSRRSRLIKKKGLVFISMVLIVIAVPLMFYLQEIAIQNTVFFSSEEVLKTEFANISKNIEVNRVETNFVQLDQKRILEVKADLKIPEGIEIDYLQQQKVKDKLEKKLDRPVQLNFSLTRTVGVLTEESIDNQEKSEEIREVLIEQIQSLESSLTIQNLNLSAPTEESNWKADLVLNANQGTEFDLSSVEQIKLEVGKIAEVDLELDVKILPLIEIQTEPVEESASLSQEINKQIYNFLELNFIEVEYEVSRLTINETENQEIKINLEIKTSESERFGEDELDQIQKVVQNKYQDQQVSLSASVIQRINYEF